VTTGAQKRREYRSPRRAKQASQTRELVLSAASTLFASRGWSATGMRDVAREAGVSVETVYANYRSKTELLMAAIDAGVVGDLEPVALAQRPEFAALGSGATPERIAAAARLITDINQRICGLRRALGEAAASEPVLAEKLAEAESRRRINVTQGVDMVLGRRGTPTQRDGVWAVTEVEVYHLLTEVAGWSVRRYREWLTDALTRLLAD
jgi:AcrR family transcriptional regulator